jgi:hypothetical protein
MKPARFPLPHWCIWDCPALETVSAPVHRAVCQIAVAYWRGGCDGLPPDDISLAILAKLPLQHFAPIKPAVVRVLADILPQLDAEHADYARRHARAVKQAQAMTAIRVSRRASRRPTGVSVQLGHCRPLCRNSRRHKRMGARRQRHRRGAYRARARRAPSQTSAGMRARPESGRADISSQYRAAPLAHSRGLNLLAALQRRSAIPLTEPSATDLAKRWDGQDAKRGARAQKRRG